VVIVDTLSEQDGKNTTSEALLGSQKQQEQNERPQSNDDVKEVSTKRDEIVPNQFQLPQPKG
jgi:hypothetical protein